MAELANSCQPLGRRLAHSGHEAAMHRLEVGCGLHLCGWTINFEASHQSYALSKTHFNLLLDLLLLLVGFFVDQGAKSTGHPRFFACHHWAVVEDLQLIDGCLVEQSVSLAWISAQFGCFLNRFKFDDLGIYRFP